MLRRNKTGGTWACGSPHRLRCWSKRQWLRCRIIELGRVGVLAEDAVCQAEGEWRLRKANRDWTVSPGEQRD